MKKWEILSKFKIQNSKFKIDDLISLLLKNRGLEKKKDIDLFLNGTLDDITVASVGIDKKELAKALKRIKQAIDNREQIVVFGDYDVDGICGSAILWETLNSLGAKVLPYIPHRIEEGYGLSIRGIENLKSQIPNPTLIITVDNGIVASGAVDFANKQNIDVIITDHHVPSKKLPKAHAIVHTVSLCGTSVAWMLSRVILNEVKDLSPKNGDSSATPQNDIKKQDHLALVALATVADLVPLKGANRVLLSEGLKILRTTKRIGIIELCKEAAVDQKSIDTYTIGHILAPRLNATGRLNYAMDSLRLLCTTNKKRAEDLAQLLGSINKDRQEITKETAAHAVAHFKSQKSKVKKMLFVAHESYQPGVIGLVAGRLVEEFYRPSIVLSIGATYSKASARSVAGFNIIEFIRSASDFLVDAGGHPMAAGFTVETAKIEILQKHLEKLAETVIADDHLVRTLRIDCELPLEIIDDKLFYDLQLLSPFGMGNSEPTFVSKVVIDEIKAIGRENKHLKLKFKINKSTNQPINQSTNKIDGIGFGLGELSSKFKPGDEIEIAYTIDMNIWNGRKSLQLKIRDIRGMN